MHRNEGNTHGYSITIFNLDGTHQGAQYGGPSEPVEENTETISRLVGADPTIKPGTYIATMERYGTGGIQSRIIHVKDPVSLNVVHFEDAEGAHVDDA
jgi:hypothetical protein